MRRGAVLMAALWFAIGTQIVLAETQSVIDPTEGLEPAKPPAATAKKPAAPDAAVKRERQRAEAEQRKRAKAEARAIAAQNETAKLRAIEQARQVEAAERDAATRDAAARDAARKAAARRAVVRAAVARAAAAKASAARIAAEKEVADREAAVRQAAALELAAREAAAREAALREAAAKQAAANEAAAREAAVREAAARETEARAAAARRAAAREAVVRLAAFRETAASDARPSRAPRFGTVFRDCADCPQLVWLPQGEFAMGESPAAGGSRPVVTIGYALAVGRFEVTFAEWDACVSAGGCRRRPSDSGWGHGWQPAINVSWLDAQEYVAWLSRRAGKRYRLLSEAEWEYAARAGTDARYWWGNQPGRGDANCADCGSKWDGRQAAPVGRFAPNPFGLYDMHGNVAEWVEDCYHDGYWGAPGDGRAWTRDCSAVTDTRIVRGGAWQSSANSMRSTFRSSAAFDYYDNRIGFRIARTE